MNRFISFFSMLLLIPTNTLTASKIIYTLEEGKVDRDLNTCVAMVLSPKNKPYLFPQGLFLGTPQEHIAEHFSNTVYVALTNKTTIGFISFDHSENKKETANISLLVVNEDFHRNGIEKALITKALSIIKNRRIIVTVYQNNIPAQMLYKKYGFSDETNGGIFFDNKTNPLCVFEKIQNN